MKSLGLMIQFLTRIPLPITIASDRKTFHDGIYYFGIVGALLGGILVVANYVFARAGMAVVPRAVLLVVLHIIMTGGLHLDGVADTADGLFSNRSAERMLDILKDSRIGSNGVLALIIVLALKVVGVSHIIDHQQWLALLLMPVIGRVCVVLAFKLGHTVRAEGMGNLFIGHARGGHLLINGLLVSSLALLMPMAVPALVTSMLLTWGIVRWSTLKIGGITGDILGFIIETTEVAFVISVLFYW